MRLKDSGYESTGVCPRCGLAPETPFHRFWECDDNNNIEDSVVRLTDRFAGDARQGASDASCFRTRGLVPMGWTLDDLPDGQLRVWAWGSLLEVISSGVKIVGGVFGTDGSGGEHGRDWRLRRCGWSVVHLDPDSLEVRGILCGTLPTV
eukprot:971231-Pyramimonas_sp.AAC.1